MRSNNGGVWFAVAVAVFLAMVAYAAVVILPVSDLAYARYGLPPLLLEAAGLLMIIGW